MKNEEKHLPLPPEILEGMKFRRLTEVCPETFAKMVEILRVAHAKKKARGGRPNKLSIEDMLLMALEYWREYRTFFHIGTSYGLSESNTYYTIKWIENVPIKDGTFSLSGKKALLDENYRIRGYSFGHNRDDDITSKKGQKNYYSGKKKRHTLKTYSLNKSG